MLFHIFASLKEKKPQPEEPEEKPQEPATPEIKGDPEMSPVYLKKLLPIFTQVYLSSMLASVR